jgi:hypothetical protein
VFGVHLHKFESRVIHDIYICHIHLTWTDVDETIGCQVFMLDE